jgi:hypothetical protein
MPGFQCARKEGNGITDFFDEHPKEDLLILLDGLSPYQSLCKDIKLVVSAL